MRTFIAALALLVACGEDEKPAEAPPSAVVTGTVVQLHGDTAHAS